MNKKHKKRLLVIFTMLAVLGIAMGLVLYALKQNINLFYTPSQLLQAQVTEEQVIRVGGYVKKNSVRFDRSGQQVTFVVTDNKNNIVVKYQGILPNLFREGQGVVIEGKLNTARVMIASQVLAKHDEKYMPKALEKELNTH